MLVQAVTFPLINRKLVTDVALSGAASQLLTTAVGKELAVLRVTTRIDSRLVVEGRLAGACVGELERCWQAIASRESAESILVDLSSVTFVDAAGKQLLTQM